MLAERGARSRYLGLGESTDIRDQPAFPDLEPWGFIPLEIGIVSAEERGLQAVSVRNNRAGNPLPLDLEELSQSVDRVGRRLVRPSSIECRRGIHRHP